MQLRHHFPTHVLGWSMIEGFSCLLAGCQLTRCCQTHCLCLSYRAPSCDRYQDVRLMTRPSGEPSDTQYWARRNGTAVVCKVMSSDAPFATVQRAWAPQSLAPEVFRAEWADTGSKSTHQSNFVVRSSAASLQTNSACVDKSPCPCSRQVPAWQLACLEVMAPLLMSGIYRQP